MLSLTVYSELLKDLLKDFKHRF